MNSSLITVDTSCCASSTIQLDTLLSILLLIISFSFIAGHWFDDDSNGSHRLVASHQMQLLIECATDLPHVL